jgi:5-methylcytosine-specific restriction endonuclease McrA
MAPATTRRCSHCRLEMSTSMFSGSRQSWCNPCRRDAADRKRRESGIPKRELTVVGSGVKCCANCRRSLPLSAYSPSARGSGGVSSYCRECTNAKGRQRKEQRAAATRAYRTRNRARHLANHRLRMFERRHRVRVSSDGTVTDTFLSDLYATEVCYYCHGKIEEAQRTAEHKLPLSRGGRHAADNLVMACWTCNSSKRDLTEEEFKQRKGKA